MDESIGVLGLLFHIFFEVFFSGLAYFTGVIFLKLTTFGKADVGEFKYCNLAGEYKERKKAVTESGLGFEEFEILRKKSNRTMWIGVAVLLSAYGMLAFCLINA